MYEVPDNYIINDEYKSLSHKEIYYKIIEDMYDRFVKFYKFKYSNFYEYGIKMYVFKHNTKMWNVQIRSNLELAVNCLDKELDKILEEECNTIIHKYYTII